MDLKCSRSGCGYVGYDCDVSGCGGSEAGVWRECGGSGCGDSVAGVGVAGVWRE